MKQLINIVLALAFASGGHTKRISKNENAEESQFPYNVDIVAKNNNGVLICGGSLIDSEWILTAAHCIDNSNEALVKLGANGHGAAEVTHQVTNDDFIIHSDWHGEKFKNDIALIRIPHTPYSDGIRSIKLPAAAGFYGVYEGDEVITSGWSGVSVSASSITNDLQGARMMVVPNALCRKHYGRTINASHICVAFSGEAAPCSVNSGSPLVLETTKTLIGVAPFGSRSGCEKDIPAVFTSLTSYLAWIKENTNLSI